MLQSANAPAAVDLLARPTVPRQTAADPARIQDSGLLINPRTRLTADLPLS